MEHFLRTKVLPYKNIRPQKISMHPLTIVSYLTYELWSFLPLQAHSVLPPGCKGRLASPHTLQLAALHQTGTPLWSCIHSVEELPPTAELVWNRPLGASSALDDQKDFMLELPQLCKWKYRNLMLYIPVWDYKLENTIQAKVRWLWKDKMVKKR